MRGWKESVENYFFTNHLDENLKEFLSSQKPLSSDEERWEFLCTTAYMWKGSYLINFDSIMLPSFFQQWNIDAFLVEFSISELSQYTLKEILYWTILTGWIMSKEDGGMRVSECLCVDMNERLQDFQYPKETCTWLHKQHFLEEIKNIYNRSQEVFLYCQEHQKDNNYPWICGMESDCSRFLRHYVFFKKHLKKPEIVRLNTFDPDQYVWYLIREGSSLYLLQLSDCG